VKGFFNIEQTQTKGGETKGNSCASCGLYRFALTPKMEPYGGFKKGIMVIGEAPGEDEDRRGRPWQGKMGRVLQRKYKQLGLDLFEDCVSLNAVNCHPTDKKGANRGPTDQEIACCRPKVMRIIEQYQPEIIILHGGVPTTSLIGHKWRGDFGGIMKWRGWTIPDREYNAWVCPTFHPSFIERQEGASEAEVIWARDLEQAFSRQGVPFPNRGEPEACVEVSNDIEGVLMKLLDHPYMTAFDIETTGLKPYNTDAHKIVTISFCQSPDKAYAIPFPTEKKHLRILKTLLKSPGVPKIAANMKYEDNWLQVLYGIKVYPWLFDTMQAAHILNNHPGITSLKFQSYVRFGVLGYDGEVSPYLKSGNSHGVNRITELVENEEWFQKLLLYNGVDSLMTYRLAISQMRELNLL